TGRIRRTAKDTKERLDAPRGEDGGSRMLRMLRPPSYASGVRDEAVRGQQQVAQRIVSNRREPHEYTRMSDVVRLEIVDVRFSAPARVALIERHHAADRVRLGIAMRPGAADHRPARPQRRHSPRRTLLDVRQAESEPSNPVEPYEFPASDSQPPASSPSA